MMRFRRSLISLFILFNIVGILAGAYQPDLPPNALRQFFLPYLKWTRLLQQWALFVPAPKQIAVKYRVDLKFEDGNTGVWRRPYPPKWDFFERHHAYHWQRLDLSAKYLEQKNVLWPDIIRYMKRITENSPSPLVRIDLVREYGLWPPPKPEGYVMPDESKLHWNEFVIFSHDVKTNRTEPI